MILVAALVVVGGTFALGQSNVLSMQSPTRPEQGELVQVSSTTNGSEEGVVTESAQQRPDGEAGSFALRGMSDLLRTLGIVGGIIGVFVLGKYVWTKVWGKHRRQPKKGEATIVVST